MKKNINIGNLYKMESPVKRQNIIVEIISIGNSYMLIDIFIKGKMHKRRRHININNNGFNFDKKNLILCPDEFVSIVSYTNIRDMIIEGWKNKINTEFKIEEVKEKYYKHFSEKWSKENEY